MRVGRQLCGVEWEAASLRRVAFEGKHWEGKIKSGESLRRTPILLVRAHIDHFTDGVEVGFSFAEEFQSVVA